MPRRPNTRPTLIYWLVDIRPETIDAGWPSGKPFYCGKTVIAPADRLRCHKYSRSRTGHRLKEKLRECGDFVQILIVETVQPSADWAARERFWIEHLRIVYPDAVNTSNGGDGAPGNIHTPESRAKMSAARKGVRLSSEWRAKVSAGLRGNRNHQGKTHSAETRAKMSAAKMGEKLSPDRIAKLRAGHRAYYAARSEASQHA